MHVLFSHQQLGSRAHSNSGVSIYSHVFTCLPTFCPPFGPSYVMGNGPFIAGAVPQSLRPGQDMAEIGQASGATRPWHPGRSSKEHGGEPCRGCDSKGGIVGYYTVFLLIGMVMFGSFCHIARIICHLHGRVVELAGPLVN